MMTPFRPHRRTLLRGAAAILAGSFFIGPAASLTAQVATPAVGEPIVLHASRVPRNSTPSGEQLLRLAGTTIDPVPLDPAVARDVNSAFMTRQVFRGLTKFDANLEPTPELAETIEISPDGLTYRFTLSDNARFSDGRQITSDDVVYSLRRALDPRTVLEAGAALAGPSYLNDIAGASEFIEGTSDELPGLVAVDEKTVEITLAEPRATFLMKLASAPGAIVDRNDVESGGEWWRDPNASGPFVVSSWEPNVELRLGRNEHFVDGAPDLESISFRIGPSASNPFNLYQADEIDTAQVPILAIDRVSDPSSPLAAELTVSPMLSTQYIAFRDDVVPMDDPEIRRAVQLAFPRWKVADILLNGQQTAAHGIIPPGTLGRDWPASAPAPDLDAAKAAIAASTYESADRVPPIRIYGATPFASEALRDVLKENLGLEIEVMDVHWPQYNAGLASRSFPAFELTWVADFPDPETFLWNLFATGSPDNYSEYSNPDYDALLAQAAQTFDTDERAELYAQAEALLLADNVVLPIAHDIRFTLTKPTVKGLVMTPLGQLYLESAWLEH
ncbi:MAG: peptide ABC transporter substrate-binding protein [Thermomicrobiales bacterium]|nr:peptide ABC transporter substrate-binding protein [Thermomicrobiales bacterium]